MNEVTPYNLDQKTLEIFARDQIAKIYDNGYNDLIWNEKDDNFDFTSEDGNKALEVTSVISSALRNVREYELAYDKKGANAHRDLDKNHYYDDGRLKYSETTSTFEIEHLFRKALQDKNRKLQRRISLNQKFQHYELCICIYECPFYDDESSFENLKEIIDREIGMFDKMFIITRDCLFVYDKQEKTYLVYNRKTRETIGENFI